MRAFFRGLLSRLKGTKAVTDEIPVVPACSRCGKETESFYDGMCLKCYEEDDAEPVPETPKLPPVRSLEEAVEREKQLSRCPHPHCDDLVLHAPGKCEHCDLYPVRQRARMIDGVCFTGEANPSKLPCPSLARRPLRAIEKWPGNRPLPKAKP